MEKSLKVMYAVCSLILLMVVLWFMYCVVGSTNNYYVVYEYTMLW